MSSPKRRGSASHASPFASLPSARAEMDSASPPLAALSRAKSSAAPKGSPPSPPIHRSSSSGSMPAVFEDSRTRAFAPRAALAPLDLWRVHLEQCPDCGHVHGRGRGGLGLAASRVERHIYDYAQGVSEDLHCPLCGDVLQSPVQAPCGHHYCSDCMRALLMRTTGRVACPLDGQVLTRFALQTADKSLLRQLDELLVRCPVCNEEVRKADLQLHLQDPVNMVEPPAAYEAILRTFYMNCPLSTFTVGELNGSSSLIRFYRRLGDMALRRFVLTTEDFIVLPDPKMGFQPHTEDDVEAFRQHGGYFNAWWVHPSFRAEVWWRDAPAKDDSDGGAAGGSSLAAALAAEAAATGADEAVASPAAARLLGETDCSSEPWHESSFMHTWSKVQKPLSPKYLCCVRDLRAEDVPMLEKFRSNVLSFLKDNYHVDESKVWIYCHYPSSARYSTLHFHIIFGGERSSRYEKYARKVGRPHQLSRQFPLDEIIETLKREPRYYETCTLCYYLGDKADLMDPISAFFGCSPHRYIRDFTFHWDPAAVLGGTAPGATPASSAPTSPSGAAPGVALLHHAAGGGERGVGAFGAADGGGAGGGAREEQAVVSELSELRRAVDGMRRTMEELQHLVEEVAASRRLEQSGASRLALLQLASLGAAGASEEPGAGLRREASFGRWDLGGVVAVSALVCAASLATVAAVVAVSVRHSGRKGA